MNVVIQTAIQPAPENKKEQTGILQKPFKAYMHRQMMSDP
jgi:hypothetical protein